MESHSVIETALQPINEDLTRIVCQHRGAHESDILRILTLMGGIRTRALENGWDPESERDLDEIRSVLDSLKTCI